MRLTCCPEARIGQEILTDDVGTDRFASTTATALAVGSARHPEQGEWHPMDTWTADVGSCPDIVDVSVGAQFRFQEAIGRDTHGRGAVTFGFTVVLASLLTGGLGVLVPIGWAALVAGRGSAVDTESQGLRGPCSDFRDRPTCGVPRFCTSIPCPSWSVFSCYCCSAVSRGPPEHGGR